MRYSIFGIFAGALVAGWVTGGAASASEGIVVQPGTGEFLSFCGAPELTVRIKVDPAKTHSDHFGAGTAQLAAGKGNFGRHENYDELIFIHRGHGSVTLGDESFPAEPGTTMYIPRGIYHGFVNEGEDEMEFLWVSAPPGFEEGLRSGSRPTGQDCPS